MKNSIAWVLGHTSNMLIAGLSAIMPNPFGMAMVLTLDNVVCDHSMTQRLNWQTVLLWNVLFRGSGLGTGLVGGSPKAGCGQPIKTWFIRRPQRGLSDPTASTGEFNFPFMSPSNEFHWKGSISNPELIAGQDSLSSTVLPSYLHPYAASIQGSPLLCASGPACPVGPLGDRTVFCVFLGHIQKGFSPFSSLAFLWRRGSTAVP